MMYSQALAGMLISHNVLRCDISALLRDYDIVLKSSRGYAGLCGDYKKVGALQNNSVM